MNTKIKNNDVDGCTNNFKMMPCGLKLSRIHTKGKVV